MKRKRSLYGIVLLLTMIISMVWNAATSNATPEEIIHLTKGASFDTTVPAPQDLGNGLHAVFTPTTPNPLNMDEGINQQVQELNQAVTPGSDGVRRAGGFSAGSVAATRWGQQTNPADGPVQLLLQGSPNGPGSMAEILPNNALITFNPLGLPDHVSGTTIDMRNDGYASCRNQISSVIECPLGLVVGHYCGVEDLVPGQCYSSFVGPYTTYQRGNMEYKVGETNNPVYVFGLAGCRVVAGKDNPSCAFNQQMNDQVEAAFPQGTPGIAAEGPTLRDLFQGGIPKVQNIPELLGQDSASVTPANPVSQIADMASQAMPEAAPIINQVAAAIAPLADSAPVIPAVAQVPAVAPAADNPVSMVQNTVAAAQSAGVIDQGTATGINTVLDTANGFATQFGIHLP
jgi:hypothetical protein